MKKQLLSAFLVLSLLLTLTSCQCKHKWTDATCESPARCSLCDATEGDVLPHEWTDATCQTLKTCAKCGITEGSLMPHAWKDATCSQPKTCTVCEATQGAKLPHTPVEEWVTRKIDYVYAETVNVQTCSHCGEEVNREILDIEKLHDNAYFMISPDDFISRLNNILASYDGNNYQAVGGSTDNSYACGIGDENADIVSILIFTSNDDMITKDKRKDNGIFSKLMGRCDYDAIPRVSCALMQAADPTLSLDDAKAYSIKLLNNGSVSVNGIKYAFTKLGGQYMIGFSVG